MAKFEIFPKEDPAQVVRLRRFFFGVAAHLMNWTFVVLCGIAGFIDRQIVIAYIFIAGLSNVLFFFMIRSGFNKRYKDPSLTALQIAVPALLGLFLMYFAGMARGAFMVLGLSMVSFGLFQFRTRSFIYIALLILTIYAALIALLMHFQPNVTNLKLELIQWLAFALALGQFSFLAGMIGKLRRNVKEKNEALAQQNAALEVALQRINNMAIHDELTNVYNRRFLIERVADETRRSARSGAIFTLCMLDIDFFKKVNDSCGHLGGDEVLRQVAQVASNALRQGDIFARYGGEEFVILLIDTQMEGAKITAERIRVLIEQLRFTDINPDLRVTISIGIAEHAKIEGVEATLKRADDALYRAKNSGRNQCMEAPTKS